MLGPKWSRKCEEKKNVAAEWSDLYLRWEFTLRSPWQEPQSKKKTQIWPSAALSSSTVQRSWQSNTSLGHLDHLLLTDFCHLVNQPSPDAYVAPLFMTVCPDISCDPCSGGFSFLVTVKPNKCYINRILKTLHSHSSVRQTLHSYFRLPALLWIPVHFLFFLFFFNTFTITVHFPV